MGFQKYYKALRELNSNWLLYLFEIEVATKFIHFQEDFLPACPYCTCMEFLMIFDEVRLNFIMGY